MLEGLTPPKSAAIYCKVDQTIATLSESDANILIAALMDQETWGDRTLSNALRERGISIADTTLRKHRNKVCACFRD